MKHQNSSDTKGVMCAMQHSSVQRPCPLWSLLAQSSTVWIQQHQPRRTSVFKPYSACFSTMRAQLLGTRLLGSWFGSQHLCYWHYASAGKILRAPKYWLQGFCSFTAAKQGGSCKLPQEPRKTSFSCVSLLLVLCQSQAVPASSETD